ncbi:MAG: glycosyltransferase family 4 protein [Candidatus Curtissbacteria bacterium]
MIKRIAQIVPLLNTVPPKKYGGIEVVAQELCLGFAQKQYKITLFGAKGSELKGKNIDFVESSPFPTVENISQNRKWEINEFLKVVAYQSNFDLLHFHYEPIILNSIIDNIEFNFLNFINKPILITFHNTTHIKENIDFYKRHKNLWQYNYVFISKNHSEPLSFFPNSTVIYNGIDVNKFTFSNTAGDYLLFLGRITDFKGILEAIQIAKLVNKKLIIAAKVDPTDEDFYNQKVKTLIDGVQIVYAGEVDFNQKNKYLRNALCLLFPIKWDEPFGLVLVEAMACGTPVVAFDRGSVKEIVEDKVTGFVVTNVNQAIEAIYKLGQIKREKCRQRAEKHFSLERMTNAYEELYKKLLS